MTYHRDISSTLKVLALAIMLFVGYKVWLKPTYFAAGPTEEHTSAAAPSPSPSAFAVPEIQKNPSDAPPSRLMDLGPAPSPTLGSIRDDLDRGNYTDVDRRLKMLAPKKLTNLLTRRYVSALWNNLGVQQEQFGGTMLSVKAFKQAVAWDPTNALAHLNLTQAYWELRDSSMTPQFLETVIRLAPQDPFPHLALAELLIDEGRTVLAAKHLEAARPRAERDPNHQSYLRKLSAKVDAIEPVRTVAAGGPQVPQASDSNTARTPESSVAHSLAPSAETAGPTNVAAVTTSQTPPRQPTQLNIAHFTVQYDGAPDEATWVRMRAILDYAFEELSQKFGHVPSKPIAVVLHTNQKFISEAGLPAWADGLFDHSSGTIHLPAQEALDDLAVFSRVARHELAHAVLHEYLKGGNKGVPKWLVEGLAIQLAEDPWPDMEEADQKIGSMTPLKSLERDWSQFQGDALRLAYIEARSATQSLVDRYSMYSVRQVMNQLQSGSSFDAAMQQKLSVSYQQFQHQWEQAQRLSLKQNS